MTFVSDIPELMKDWDWEKNVVSPDEITHGCHKRVYWQCSKCSYCWSTRMDSRGTRNRGCPACANRVVTDKNSLGVNFPALVLEFNVDKNGGKTPFDYIFSSPKKVWWICGECGYEWRAVIRTRTQVGCGCPACAGKVAFKDNCLECFCPEILNEFDYQKNNFSPKDITPRSSKRVYWRCRKGHSWEVSPKSRLDSKGNIRTGCPVCSNHKLTLDNSLHSMFPDIAKDWDIKQNKISSKEVVAGGKFIAAWKCSVCGHKWCTSVDNRVSKKSGCPKCAYSSISSVSQQWLDCLGVKCKEYRIESLGVRGMWVDGYDKDTNTVYEFLGDFWHGNLDIYNGKDLNPVNKKTFGSLNQETKNRLRCLEKAGFKVVFVWEKDFKVGKLISEGV